jgi:hypothetical protein
MVLPPEPDGEWQSVAHIDHIGNVYSVIKLHYHEWTEGLGELRHSEWDMWDALRAAAACLNADLKGNWEIDLSSLSAGHGRGTIKLRRRL